MDLANDHMSVFIKPFSNTMHYVRLTVAQTLSGTSTSRRPSASFQLSLSSAQVAAAAAHETGCRRHLHPAQATAAQCAFFQEPMGQRERRHEVRQAVHGKPTLTS